MKEHKTKIIIGIVLVIIIYLVYRYHSAKKNNNVEKTSTGTGTTTTNNISSGGTSSSSSSTCTNSTVLKRGSKCDRVQWSQYKINQVVSKLGISKLTEDGIFGAKTETAFQKLLGKTTGSWNEVLSKVTAISTLPAVGTGTTINDSIKW